MRILGLESSRAVIRFILHIIKGLLRDGRMRRTMMFYSVLAALLILFCGATFFDAWLRARPMVFLAYWAVCAWATVFSVLLAIFDMLMVRLAVRQDKRKIAQQFLHEDPTVSDENTP